MTPLKRLIPVVLAVLLSACIELPEIAEPASPPDSGIPDGGGPKPDGGVPADTTPPTITSTTPADSSTNVATTPQLQVTFSETMNVGTVQVNIAPTVGLTAPSWANGNTQLTMQPTAQLAQNTGYTLAIDGKDVAGNALAGRKLFSFTTTGPAPDTTPPTVLRVSPARDAIGVARNASITVTFSEPMDRASAETSFDITSPTGFKEGIFDWNAAGTEMTFNPDADFPYGTDVAWRVSTTAKDLAANTLKNSDTGTFRAIRKTSVLLPYDTTISDMVFNFGDESTPRLQYHVGDDAADHAVRTFFGFDLRGLPQDPTRITSAQFRLRITGANGDPFSKLGNLLLESVYYGPTIDRTISDYDTPPLGQGSIIPSSMVGNEGFIDVTQFVQSDWANRNSRSNYSEFRLRFEIQTNSDALRSHVYFDREDPSLIPEFAKLLLEYEHP